MQTFVRLERKIQTTSTTHLSSIYNIKQRYNKSINTTILIPKILKKKKRKLWSLKHIFILLLDKVNNILPGWDVLADSWASWVPKVCSRSRNSLNSSTNFNRPTETFDSITSVTADCVSSLLLRVDESYWNAGFNQ